MLVKILLPQAIDKAMDWENLFSLIDVIESRAHREALALSPQRFVLTFSIRSHVPVFQISDASFVIILESATYFCFVFADPSKHEGSEYPSYSATSSIGQMIRKKILQVNYLQRSISSICYVQ